MKNDFFQMLLTLQRVLLSMIQIMEDCRSCFAAGQFMDAGSVTENIF